MKRKIVQQGPATLMVSLPAKWVKQYGMKKGNDIDMTEEGPRLILQAEGRAEPEKLKIHIKDVKKFPDRMINVPFRQGYDELIVEFDDAKAMPEIEKKVDKLLGFEIVDQKEKSCTIKSFAIMEEHDFEQLLRRTFLLVLNMARDSADALNKGELDRLRAIGDIERTVEKFAQFSMRMINKNNALKSKEATFQFATIWMIEQASDNFAAFCNIVGDNKMKLKKETIALYRQIVKLYDDFYNLYYKRNIDESVRLKEQIRRLRKEAFSLIDKQDGEPINYLINILDRLNELSYLFV
ncbi:MAG: hypothetical protein KJ574_03565 [Nanoarchaeota archaeon]|nr:hypothetical protein [Nanoarchaeota archaeon]